MAGSSRAASWIRTFLPWVPSADPAADGERLFRWLSQFLRQGGMG